MRKCGAFTIVELIAVTAVIGVMATAIAIASRSWLEPALLQQDIARIIEIDRYARDSAVSESIDVAITYSYDGGSAGITSAMNTGSREAQAQTEFNGKIKRVRTYGGSRSGSRTIRCTQLGVTPSYAVEIHTGDSSRIVFLAGGTGYAQTVRTWSEAGRYD